MFAIGLSLLLLVGWAIRPAVLGFLPGLTERTIATAIPLGFAGTGFLLKRRTPRLAKTIGWLISMSLSLILLSHSLAPLVDEPLLLGSLFSPVTSVGLLLVGLSLALWDRLIGHQHDWSEWLAPGVGLIAFVYLLAHAYDTATPSAGLSELAMASHTGLGLLACALASDCAPPHQGLSGVLTRSTSTGVVTRRMIPAAFLVPSAMGGLATWSVPSDRLHAPFALALMAVGSTLVLLAFIWWTAKTLEKVTAEERAFHNAQNQAVERLRHGQKMEAVSRLAGGIAHDFNNLLTVISTYTDIIEADAPPNSSLASDIAEVSKATKRARSLTSALLSFSRRPPQQGSTLDLNEVLMEWEKVLGRVLGKAVDIKYSLAADVGTISADRRSIEQVLMNLALNASDAMPDGGHITIATSKLEVSGEHHPLGLVPGHYVSLSIADEGSGMNDETRARIFEPFFTTKPREKGIGLGLPTVAALVEQHDGTISVETQPGAGTVVTVCFPLTEAHDRRASGTRRVADSKSRTPVAQESTVRPANG